MNRIKVEKMLRDYIGASSVKCPPSIHKLYKEAIQNIIEDVVDMCANEADCTIETYHSQQEGQTIEIDKVSILQVKYMIDYE